MWADQLVAAVQELTMAAVGYVLERTWTLTLGAFGVAVGLAVLLGDDNV